jgi:hypothetical protein
MIIDKLGQEAAREDVKAREACAAHRRDDCDLAREMAKGLRAKADEERARSVTPVHLGDCSSE